jgi:hypothetical protein
MNTINVTVLTIAPETIPHAAHLGAGRRRRTSTV